MTHNVIVSDITGAGAIITLGNTDSVTVSEGVMVGSTTDTGSIQTIIGTGNNQKAVIFGAVSGYYNGIVLGDDTTNDFAQKIFIGETGTVSSMTGAAVTINGYNSKVQNDGLIQSFLTGVMLQGNNNIYNSTLVNRGTISGDSSGVSTIGTQGSSITNWGTIMSDSDAFNGQLTTGKIVFVNYGTILGAIRLGEGNDTYTNNGFSNGGIVYGYIGNDTLTGGTGSDSLSGDDGKDTLTGGAKNDVFYYDDFAESGPAKAARDLITDFSHRQADRIDLSEIDAVDGGSDDAFIFLGADRFTGTEGELRAVRSARDTTVFGDIDGDKLADFAITLTGAMTLVAGDFVL